MSLCNTTFDLKINLGQSDLYLMVQRFLSFIFCSEKHFSFIGQIQASYAVMRQLLLARLYVSTGRAIAVTTGSASASTSMSALLKMLKFLIKVFKSLYLLNLWMDLVDTLPDVRYWSDVLCCTITTHISDKVTVFIILS